MLFATLYLSVWIIMLKASHISHAFDYPLFDDISLELTSGGSIAVIGISGSGKSTLLHILATLLRPKEGKVELFGEDLYALGSDEISRIRRSRVGIIFQSHYLFKGFSALENIEVASLMTHRQIDESLIERLDINRVINQRVTELSGGQQQRVSIARILTKRPKLIFADEPTGNLDRKTADEVMAIIFSYIKENGAGLFLVTHDEVLARRCDKVYRLENRKLVETKN